MFARLFGSEQPKKLTLHLFMNKAFSGEPIVMAMNSATTALGEVQNFIQSNSCTGHQQAPPHALIISGNRISLDHFMEQEPSLNFYTYLKKNGYTHSADNPNDVAIAIVVATYEDIQKFIAQETLKKDRLRSVAHSEVHSGRAEGPAHLGMHIIQTGKIPALMGLVLCRAMGSEPKQAERTTGFKF